MTTPAARPWFPHLDFAGEPMREGQFREPYPMAEEVTLALTKEQIVRIYVAGIGQGSDECQAFESGTSAPYDRRARLADELFDILNEGKLIVDDRAPYGTVDEIWAWVHRNAATPS